MKDPRVTLVKELPGEAGKKNTTLKGSRQLIFHLQVSSRAGYVCGYVAQYEQIPASIRRRSLHQNWNGIYPEGEKAGSSEPDIQIFFKKVFIFFHVFLVCARVLVLFPLNQLTQ